MCASIYIMEDFTPAEDIDEMTLNQMNNMRFESMTDSLLWPLSILLSIFILWGIVQIYRKTNRKSGVVKIVICTFLLALLWVLSVYFHNAGLAPLNLVV